MGGLRERASAALSDASMETSRTDMSDPTPDPVLIHNKRKP